jgi:zinc protease
VPVLDVLSCCSAAGAVRGLYQQVRERQGVVHHVDAWTYNPGNTGLFGMSAVVDADKFTAARDAMLAEIEKVKSMSVSADEVHKAAKQFISATLSARKTMEGQAQNLGGNWLAANDLNFSERYLAAIKNVSHADVQRVARHYLTAENRTLYALLPNGTSPKISAAVETNTDIRSKIYAAERPAFAVKEDHRLPFVEFRAAFKGGVLAETPANNGITHDARQNAAARARKSVHAEKIATEIESVGGHIDSYGGNNSFGVNAEVLSSDFAIGLDLLADVLLNPTFPAAPLEREREVQIASISARKDDLLKSASVAMRRALFGDTGYGLDRSARKKAWKNFRRRPEIVSSKIRRAEQLRARHLWRRERCEVKAAVEKAFGNWKRATSKLIRISPIQALSIRRSASRKRATKSRPCWSSAFAARRLFDDDRYALELIQESCSDLGSRLFLRIREQLGLAYYVGAQNFMGLAPGYFAFYTGTEPIEGRAGGN